MSVRASGDLPSRRPREFGNRGAQNALASAKLPSNQSHDYTSQYTMIDNAIVYVTTFVKGLVSAAAAAKRSRIRV